MKPTAFVNASTVALVALVAAACTREGPDQLLASARDYMTRSEYAAAGIQARNAVQAKPDSAEARVVLGQALLANHDAVGAESEFRRALQLGASPDDVLPLLAQSLIGAGKAEALVREFGDRLPAAPAARARFADSLGDAYTLLGRRDEAERAYGTALAAVPGDTNARLGLAQLAARNGRFDEALAATEAIIASNPTSAPAHALKSDILLAQRNPVGARQALERAVEVDGNYLPARYALISALIEENAVDAAKTHLAVAGKLAPDDIRLVYLQSALALRSGDLAAARDKASLILKARPEHVPTLVLMARIDLQLQQFASAEAHLRQALKMAPGHREARRLLAAGYLRAGQAAKAQQALQPMLDDGDRADPQLLLLAGEASLASGDVAQATRYYEQAAARGQKTALAAAQTRLGQIAFASGRPEVGMERLDSASTADPSFRQTDLARIASLLRAGHLDKALAAAKALEKKSPNDPTSHHLVGTVQLARRDRAAARASFERALALNPMFVPSARALSELDIADRKPEVAQRRYDAMIAKEPRNATLHLALAELRARTGARPEDVIKTLQDAVAADPSSDDARIALIAALARTGNTRGALTAAQEASAAQPSSAQILQMLAVLQAEVGDHQQSLETLRKVSQLQPGNALPYQRVAARQAQNKQYDKAVDALRIAKELVPADLGLSRDLILVYLAAGRTADALAEARSVQRSAPRKSAGWLLESQVHEHARDHAAAEKALRQGLKVEPDAGLLAARLHGALIAAGKTDDAEAFVRKWLADYPKDTALRIYLGDRDLAAKNFRGAAAQYKAVLAVDANNVVALNNLAWIAGQTDDPNALGYAERAVRLAPDSAAVLDTMGTLLVARGEAERGVDYLARASRIAPDRADIRLNYAKGLVRAGRKDQARRELEAMLANPNDFAGKAEVAALLKTL
jgi:putative PEP-CTERM system TPR-repeat lipoprotein